MKPLAFLALLSVLAVPAAAGSTEKPDPLKAGDTAALKERFKSQVPPAVSPEVQFPASPEISIEELERLLLLDKRCKKNPDDTKDLAPEFKGKYGLIACEDGQQNMQEMLLVPRSVSRSQQMLFEAPAGVKLLRARFAGHYFVLEFDTQIQYLDLRRQTKFGFELGGFVANKRADRFTELPIFLDALKNYLGAGDGGPHAAAIEKVRRSAKETTFREFEAILSDKGILTVMGLTANGTRYLLWPELKDQPADTRP